MSFSKFRDKKPQICIVCGGYCAVGDSMHLLPRSTYPQYRMTEQNIWRGHRECHTRYDDDKKFRSKQKHIIDIVRKFATEQEVNRYYEV